MLVLLQHHQGVTGRVESMMYSCQRFFTLNNFRTSVQSTTTVIHTHGCTDFYKKQEPPQNSRCQKGDMKQVPFWGSTNSRHHHTKLSSHSDRPQDMYIPAHTSHICPSAWHYYWIQYTIKYGVQVAPNDIKSLTGFGKICTLV
jgi:hypothetical protein